MRVQSFSEMLLEYGISKLDFDEELSRQEMLAILPFSIIIEGGHMELENFEKWLSMTFSQDAVNYLFYSKTGYDFCFAEYFFDDEKSMIKSTQVIPRIYTQYPHSLTPDKALRSIGYDNEETADPKDKTAIIFTGQA